MSRYATPGPWTCTQRFDSEVGAVQIEVGPLIDTRTGTRYADGAERVTIAGPQGRPRGKTFKGETAWSQALSYARDCIHWLDSHDSEGMPRR